MKSIPESIKIIPEKLFVEILLMFISDLISFSIAFGFVNLFRYILFVNHYETIIDPQVIRTILYLVVISLILLSTRGLYPGWGRSSVVELKQIVEAITIAYVITSVIIFVQGILIDFSRSVFILSWFFVIIILPVSRFLIRKLIAKFPWWGEPVVIIGLEDKVSEAVLRLANCQRLGLRPVVGLSLNSKKKIMKNRILIIPWSTEAQKRIQNAGVNTNILAISTNDLRSKYPQAFNHIGLSFKKTIFFLDEDLYSTMMAQPADIAGLPAIIATQSLFNPIIRFTKQIFEIMLMVIILVPVLIIGGIIALLIKLDSPGPIFFTQERIGKNRGKFNLVKFRTMVNNSDEIIEDLLNDPKNKQEWETYHKITNDLRITRVGNWIRKFSLDELPQFINILKGDMALIGPRPLVKAEIDEIGEAATMILKIQPGITGWWQVMGRNNLTFEERTRLDLYYVFNWSLWLDLFIFIKTFWVIFFKNGAKN
jgi:Undecaprenyl-phosphate galactose phosphotransferase WbaP